MKNIKDTFSKYWFLGVLIISMILIPLIWYYNLILPSTHNLKIEEAGAFGDRFGAATSLFGGITIILLLLTIHLQRIEIADGKSEFKQQNKTLRHQRFENTFFKLLELQTFITNELKAFYFKDSGEKKEPTFKGELIELSGSVQKEFIGKAAVAEELDFLLIYLGKLNSKDIPIDYVDNYQSYADSNIAPFERYLVNIKTIYDFICNSKEIDLEEKPFYVRLFAMQLNPYELVYYFYYMTLYADVTSETQAQELDLVQYINPDLLGNYSHLYFYQKNV